MPPGVLSLEGRATSLIESTNLNTEAGMLDAEPSSIDGISFAFTDCLLKNDHCSVDLALVE